MSALAIINRVRRLQALRASRLPKKTAEVVVRTPRVDLDRWKDDFTGFAGHLDIVPKSGIRTKLRPNAIQTAFEVSRSGRDIVLKPRQVGLTTWELARDIWFFLTRRGARVVVVCQSISDDSAIKEISEKLRVMFESLRALGVTMVQSSSTTEWKLPERDASLRVIGAGASEAAAEKKGRAGTIHRLHITECAFYEYASATLNAILECVPPAEFGTEVVIESTANGASGLFYEYYQDAKAGRSSSRAHFFSWLNVTEYRAAVTANDNLVPETPREKEIVEKHGATPEQLKWYRAKVADKKSQDLVDQEYPTDEETCWITSGRLFFDRERTKELLSASVAPIETRQVGREGAHGVLRIWKRPEPGHSYVIAADPSEGVGGDPAAAVVLDRATGEHVATIHGQFATWEFARVLAVVGREYAQAMIAVERNNHGHAVLQALDREQKYERIYEGRDERKGWLTNAIARATALEALHDAHYGKTWRSPERESLNEMLRFIVLANGKPEAAPGAHDDLVIAHAIAWDVLSTPIVDRRRHEVLDYDETDDAA